MQSSPLLLEEPVRMASILEPSKPSFFPAMTKIVGTLGPKSRSVDVISRCLDAGMSVARFDFSWGDQEYHQETLENLKAAIKSTKKLCAVNMPDFVYVYLILCEQYMQDKCFEFEDFYGKLKEESTRSVNVFEDICQRKSDLGRFKRLRRQKRNLRRRRRK